LRIDKHEEDVISCSGRDHVLGVQREPATPAVQWVLLVIPPPAAETAQSVVLLCASGHIQIQEMGFSHVMGE
jgi:hypothetical protein